MKTFAVIGNPIAHSRSPDIHRAFAAQTGIVLDYQRLGAPITDDGSGFIETARAFFADGGEGLNVTAPFKEVAFRSASVVSERSRLSEAANTLWKDGRGGWRADNTDGPGLVRDLSGRLGLMLTDARILLLGAGGASAGILGPLLETRPAQLALWNRSPEKAQRLVDRFARAYPDARIDVATSLMPSLPFDLVIHATSLRQAPDPWPWPASLCAPETFFYDLIYADAPTAFLRWAEACGGQQRSDGFGMLLEQAAESFQIWHGVLPDTAAVFAALRATTNRVRP